MNHNIVVTWGTGYGPTKLAAYDCALHAAGVAQYNIIYLSSVIPSESKILVKKFQPSLEEYGNRLYGVVSKTSSFKDSEVWAGLGWSLKKQDGSGVFVEHHGYSKEVVEKNIARSLIAMRILRPELKPDVYSKITGISRKDIEDPDHAICAIVCAVFKIAPW